MRLIVGATVLGVLLVGSAAFAAETTKVQGGFGDFISPVSNPVQFEDARPTTEVRPIYVYHKISDDFPIEGDAHVAAMQLRYAVTERFGLIATKDGHVWLNPKGGRSVNGWANLGFGAKYALLYDPAARFALTLGGRYETTSGERDVFQGNGDGILNPFLSVAWGLGDFHLLGYTGGRLPISGADSTFFDLSLHADYKIGPFYPLFEMNWVQCVDGGRRLGIDQEGFDFFNLGSEKAGGHGVVTAAFGARWRAVDDLDVAGHSAGIDIGFTGEFPMTDREDIFGWRTTTDLIFFVR